MISRTGWTPSPFDARDYPFNRADVVDTSVRSLILEHPFPARNQQSVPCCVSCAVVVCMEIIDTRNPPQIALSSLFHYYLTRPNPNSLVDLTLRDGLRSAVLNGICSLASHNQNFDRPGAMINPTNVAKQEAFAQRLVAINPITEQAEYYILSDYNRKESWRKALRIGMPILLGFWATSSYFSLSASNAVLRPSSNSNSNSGHAAVVIGFDDNREMFLVKDSRGTDFGTQGHWWLSYEAAESRLVVEAWAIGKISY